MGALTAAVLLAVGGLLLVGGGAPAVQGSTSAGGTTYTPASTSYQATTSPKVVPTQGNPNGRWQALDFQDGAVRIPAGVVSRTASWYAAPVDGVWVKFLMVQGSDGVVRAAFDSCDICYPNHKGYRQEGDYLVCNNCGTAFPSTAINVNVRGCNPIYLPFTEDGSCYVITKSDLGLERDKFA